MVRKKSRKVSDGYTTHSFMFKITLLDQFMYFYTIFPQYKKAPVIKTEAFITGWLWLENSFF